MSHTLSTQQIMEIKEAEDDLRRGKANLREVIREVEEGRMSAGSGEVFAESGGLMLTRQLGSESTSIYIRRKEG